METIWEMQIGNRIFYIQYYEHMLNYSVGPYQAICAEVIGHESRMVYLNQFDRDYDLMTRMLYVEKALKSGAYSGIDVKEFCKEILG